MKRDFEQNGETQLDWENKIKVLELLTISFPAAVPLYLVLNMVELLAFLQLCQVLVFDDIALAVIDLRGLAGAIFVSVVGDCAHLVGI